MLWTPSKFHPSELFSLVPKIYAHMKEAPFAHSTFGRMEAQSGTTSSVDAVKGQQENVEMSFLRPPVVRLGAGAALNRALFTKKVDLAAAAIQSPKVIAHYRKALQTSQEMLKVDRISPIVSHPDKELGAQGRKCILLNPSVKAEEPTTWGPVIQEGIQKEELTVIPYELTLEYDYWTARDTMESVLPPELHDEIPSGFNVAGHVAHLNLRDSYLSYKKVVAEIILDKNPSIKTVINKVDNVGAESEFRTFQYEVLAGEDDLNVSCTENNCSFNFDYSKVYWNSKLEYEHTRIISFFKPGEVVCDVMAGIGPFALPAGKKRVFVWANDKNPESYKCLKANIQKNKVQDFVRPFCEDGLGFIRQATDEILAASLKGEKVVITKPGPRSKSKKTDKPTTPGFVPEPLKPLITETYPLPPTISHFVMNLPASAIEFVGSFKGIYQLQESLFAPTTKTLLPLVHVHCFALKADDERPLIDICEKLTKYLGFPMKPGNIDYNLNGEGEVAIHNVRDVAPAKSMYCATFRLPAAVAFAARD
ncbi:tRNA(m(1)G37)methyltransferase [Podospora pseudocomata]|uniref:tRNA (guanine(37)-N1)-methyltransferase n=1 Tax=Podospora pseudocomata TaxID=2093779 RepID=A0ABR0GV81_9PEZI|nr:tRNA(m(1)G37)methyltransferase [Podospora pseudocomata]